MSDSSIETNLNLEQVDNFQTDDLSAEISKKLKFDPPLYVQRYDYLCYLLKKFNCKSFMDIGCAECKLLHLLKQSDEDLNLIVGLDIDEELLERSKSKFTDNLADLIQSRKGPLDLYIVKGDVSNPDQNFINKFAYDKSGLDFVSLIEIIEHMYPETLNNCIDTIFSKLKPKYVLITTPNSEFNTVFEELDPNGNLYDERKINQKFRHWDHKFEWTRNEFQTWCEQNILNVYKNYKLLNDSYDGLGLPPTGYEDVGFCTQMALFVNQEYEKLDENHEHLNEFQLYLKEKKRIYLKNRNRKLNDEFIFQKMYYSENESKSCEKPKRFRIDNTYKIIHSFSYPFELYEFENIEDRNKALFDEIYYLINFLTAPSKYSRYSYTQLCSDSNDLTSHLTEEEKEKLDNDLDLYDENIRLAKVEILLDFESIKKFRIKNEEIISIMKQNGFKFTKNHKYLIHIICEDSDYSEDDESIENYRDHKMIDCPSKKDEESIEIMNEFETENSNETLIKFDEENWDQYLPAQEPCLADPNRISLVDQFEDADENNSSNSNEFILKCLNFQFKSRRDRLRLSDFKSYNYYSDNQKKITYHLRAVKKKNLRQVLNDDNLNDEQFSLD